MSAVAFAEILALEREFDAPIIRVFAAWTEAEMLVQWFGPENFSVVNVDIDCQPQGKYDITIEAPDKSRVRHFGEYIEIDEPNKLVFTWVLEGQTCQGSAGQHATTLVELDFIALGEKTLLKLRHEKLPDQTAYDGHRFGWLGCLDSLSNLLNQ